MLPEGVADGSGREMRDPQEVAAAAADECAVADQHVVPHPVQRSVPRRPVEALEAQAQQLVHEDAVGMQGGEGRLEIVVIPGGPNPWKLRALVLVPEPTTLVLLGLGLAGG